jgi:RimJ/RimL family protein N-acetyltransferase
VPDAPDSERVTLAPGLEVLIRPIRPEDRGLMSEGLSNLSPEARYQRFFAPVESFSESDLTYLTEIDHSRHEALVAVDPEDGSLVGVARYVCITRSEEPIAVPGSSNDDDARSDDPMAVPAADVLTEAEVAVIVGEPWQGKGLATALLQRLTKRASEEGVDYFVAIVLEDNDGAAELFKHLVEAASEVSDGEPGTVEIRIELPGPESFSDSILARALSGSARGSLKVAPWRRMQRRLARNRQRRKAREG